MALRKSDPKPQIAQVTPPAAIAGRSEEHTSELQSRLHLVCRLLLEKKKNNLLSTDGEPETSDSNPICKYRSSLLPKFMWWKLKDDVSWSSNTQVRFDKYNFQCPCP